MPTLQHLLGAVVLLIIVIATGATADSPNSDLICHGDRCYPRVFVPTEEFQDIEDDQTIPPGIHVVLDVTTGKRRGKLLSKDDVPEGSNATKVHDLVIGDDGSIQAIPVKNDDQFDDVSTGEVTANVSSTENMYAGLESPSDYERFTTSIQVIRDAVQRGPENMPAQLPQALSILEDLVHELDRGRDLAKNGGLEAVTQLLSMSWPASIRSNTATVIGAALSVSVKHFLKKHG
jgi:nucleotide exchange factor SIL1